MTKSSGSSVHDGGLHPALLGGGVFATFDELCELRRLAGGLDLTRSRRSSARRDGSIRSPFPGRGMELDEVRAYQPGEDVRRLHWRVTARTGRPHSKRFHEERERPLMLLVDARAPMQFGSRGCFKSVAAARWAALVAWAGLAAGHRVGGLVLSARGCVAFAPRARGRGLRGLIRELADATATPPQAAGSLADSLAELRRLAPRGSQIFVLSDFADFDDEAAERLLALHRRCDVSCVFVYDPLEESAPPSGHYRISDGRESREVSTVGQRMRERWSHPFCARRNRVEGFCVRHRIPFESVRTGSAPEGAALASLARSKR